MRFDALVLTPEYGPLTFGGLGVYVTRLVDGLCARGHRLAVLLPHLADEDAQVELGNGSKLFLLAVKELPYRSHAQALRFARGARALAARLGLEAPVLHAHDYAVLPAAVALKRQLGARLAVTFHQMQVHRRLALSPKILDYTMAQLEAVERHGLLAADELFCISGHMRQALEATGHVGSRARLHTVHFPLVPARWLSAARRRALRERYVRPGEKLVVFAGRRHPQKGAGPLLRACAALLPTRRDFRLLLLGGAATADELYESVPPEHAARVISAGPVEHAQVLQLLQAADVGVVPSLYEPYGIIALEMLAAGLPLVHSAVDGLAELPRLVGRPKGLLFPVPVRSPSPRERVLDEGALARRLAQALRLPPSTAAQRKARAGLLDHEQLSAERFFEIHERVYQPRARGLTAPAPRARR